jgi:hypothetical protein
MTVLGCVLGILAVARILVYIIAIVRTAKDKKPEDL